MEAEPKLQPYLLLAKGARGRALADLIVKATSEPGLFAFAELLDLPQVQELRAHAELGAYVRALEIFCYGTWRDYHHHHGASSATTPPPPPLPPLTPQQQLKLRQATAVSLASAAPLSSGRELRYADLSDALGLPSARALEDFLIADCIYAGLLRGRLDGVRGALAVEAAPCRRDCPRAAVPAVCGALTAWLERVRAVSASLEERLAFLDAAGADVARRRERHARRVEGARRAIRDEAAARRAQAQMAAADAAAAAAGMGGYGPAGDEGPMDDRRTEAAEAAMLAAALRASAEERVDSEEEGGWGYGAGAGAGGAGAGGAGAGGLGGSGGGESGGGGGGGGGGGPGSGGGGAAGAFGAVRPKRRR